MIISFTGKEAARGKIKKPPGGGSVPSFSRFIRAYRFPDGMALAPLRKANKRSTVIKIFTIESGGQGIGPTPARTFSFS